ncbi:MAG: hypothetical protein L6262_06560 [Weeksellaceae bacterium]|nr:hypothetical protein [Weeksellaceae bacterium]
MRTYILLLFFFIFKNVVIAQSSSTVPEEASTFLPNIIPPSPTAYKLGNFGNVPIGLFTGSLNLQVPLTEFSSGKMSIPIYLFYGSNGIKVDDVSGNVGIGWNLNFGGVITKTIRDLDDDWQQPVPIPEKLNGNSLKSSIANAFYYLGGNTLADTERDLYNFNFNGHSGKFFFDENNEPVLLSQENLKINKEIPKGFSITTADGTKYLFTEEEKTSFRMSGDGFANPGSMHPTAWYLSKINDTNGDEIYFTYGDSGSYYVVSQSQSLKTLTHAPQYGCSGFISAIPQVSGIIFQQMRIVGKKIVKISSKKAEDGEINFQYGSTPDPEGFFKISSISKKNKNLHLIDKVDFSYDVTVNDRTFLKVVSFLDANKSYAFEYISQELFPKRLDFGQDHWGYFNGKENLNKLVPKNLEGYGLEEFNYEGADKEPVSSFAQIGLLKKIIYPSKGYTNVTYEGNDYWGTKTIYPQVKQKWLSINTTQNAPGTFDQFVISVQDDHWIKVDGRSFFNTECEYPTGSNHSSSTLYVFDENNEQVPLWRYSTNFFQYFPAENSLFLDDGQQFYVEAKAGKTYTVRLYTESNCTSANCIIYYKDDPIQIFDTNLPTGGIRVKSTENFSSQETSKEYKRYYYNSLSDSLKSSGDSGVKPIYYDTQIVRQYCPSDGNADMSFVENSFLVVNSSSMISLFNSGNSNCYYPEVTISYGGDNFEKGAEYKQYIIDRDEHGENIFGSSPVLSSPWTNLSWDNGLENLSIIFDANKTNIIKEVRQNYEVNNYFTKEVKSYSFRNNYEIKIMSFLPHSCTEYEVNNYSPNRCFNQPIGKIVNLPQITNLDIMEYKNISRRHYLQSQTTTEYVNGSPLLTTTEYFYTNPSHYQLTQQKTTFPDWSSQTTDYSYAHEKGKTLMINRNMVGIPLETVTKKGSTIISKTETVYPDVLPDIQTANLLLPKSASSLDLVTGNLSTEVTYDQYDAKGNLQQYTTKSGIPTAIVWGYNQTQPIAKIEGAKYSQVSAFISNIVGQSDADSTSGTTTSEQDVVDALDLFRQESELSGFQITTYSYDPLIGVKSITPPSGVRQVYIYDTANRLMEVREQSQTGNILKEYQYHYKTSN